MGAVIGALLVAGGASAAVWLRLGELRASQIDTEPVFGRGSAPFALHRVWLEVLRTQVRTLVRMTPVGVR